jgi:3-hydroxymyristoyl/3-hydroxydecanoyl-(acyl carrier protein) dehydratase
MDRHNKQPNRLFPARTFRIVDPNSAVIPLSPAGIDAVARDLDLRQASLEFTIPTDLPLFAGHFPGQPILPGVVELDCVVSMVAEVYPQLGESQFAGLSAVKFKSPVAPGDRLSVTLNRKELAVAFVIKRGATVCAQGTLHYSRPYQQQVAS